MSQSVPFEENMQFLESKNGIGLKIDLRFIAHIEDPWKSFAAGEIARIRKDSKICSDQEKILREGKDILDGIANIALNIERRKQRK